MDPSSFPKQYGGELDWEWGDPPLLDEPARELAGGLELPAGEGEKRPGFIKGPVLFHGDKIEVLGTENGKPRRATIPVPQPEETKANGVAVTKPSDENEKTALETANGAAPVSNETPVA